MSKTDTIKEVDTLKEIWDKNHPSLLELISKNYTSLNDIIKEYNKFFKKLDKLEDINKWLKPLEEEQNYTKLNTLYNRIKEDLIKGFKVVEFKPYSIDIEHKSDIVSIVYLDRMKNYNMFKIEDFTKKTTGSINLNHLNIKGNKLNIAKVIDEIIANVDPKWIMMIHSYMEECKKIDEYNKSIIEINNKINSENNTIKEKYTTIKKTLEELRTIFPIEFDNKELLIPKDITMTSYKIVTEDKKITDISSNDMDDGIIDLVFEKSKVNEESIPSWVNNPNLFNNIDNIEKDIKTILKEYQELKNKYHQYLTSKNENNVKNEIEVLKKRVQIVLEKLDENNITHKKYALPDKILFSLNKEAIKTIDKRFIKYLKYIDLSKNNFTNVDVRKVDFSETNPILLDPQKVYNKDLTGIKLALGSKVPKISFNGCNLSNALITLSKNVEVNLNDIHIDNLTKIQIDNEVLDLKNQSIKR